MTDANDKKENKPHFHEHRRRLKDKFVKNGLEGFHDYETLELLLTYAIPRRDVKPLAKELINRFKNFQGVLDAPVRELESVDGIGEHSAVLIRLVKDTAGFYLKRKAQDKPRICSSPELINYCMLTMGSLKDEEFRVVFLNTQNEIIEIETLQEGTIDQSVVYPRKVMERALHYKAAALIFVHNHPGGNIKPSYADREITKTLVTAAESMDIDVYDHLIVGKDSFYSFRDAGMM